MKFLKVFFVFALMSMFVISCEESTSSEEPSTPSYGTLSGVVLDGNGGPLAGVTISFRDSVATTSEQGWFTINSLRVNSGNDFETVIFTKENYSTNVKRVRIFAYNTTHLTNVILQQDQIIAFDNSNGGTMYLNPSSTEIGMITIEPNTFVNEDGSAYTGEVTITANGSLPTDDNFFEVFPGEFTGIRSDGSEVSLISIGFMQVTALSEDRTELKIAGDKTVNLQLQSSTAVAGDEIPMWYLNEDTGIWEEEGLAMANAEGLFETEVAHFSSWNWDYPAEDMCYLTGRIFNPDGYPVNNAVVYGQGTDIGYYDVAYTDSYGSYTLRALKNTYINIAASTGTYSSDVISFYVDADCNNNVIEDITVYSQSFSVTLTWGEVPSDLDSHLLVPATEAYPDGYHLFYGDMGSIIDYPNAMLDTDDTSSFGPEIITSFRLHEGTYSYYVYNYSQSPDIATSQGVVTLNTSTVNRVYNVPTENPLAYLNWHVFDLVVSSNGSSTVVNINELTDSVGGDKLFVMPPKK